MKGLFIPSRIPPITKSTLEKNSQNSKQQSPPKEEKTKDEDTKKATGKHIGEVQTYSQEDVAKLGEDKSTGNHTFCESRGVMSYLEAKEQFDREVLLNDDYYNGIINVRIGGSKLLRESLQDR